MYRPELAKTFHELAAVEDGAVLRWQLTQPDSDEHTVGIAAMPKGVAILYQHQWRTSTIPFADFAGELDHEFLAKSFGLGGPQPPKNPPTESGTGWDRFPSTKGTSDDGSNDRRDRELALLITIHDRFRETFLADYRLVDGVPRRRTP